MGLVEAVSAMLPELGHLPPGTPALLLIMGGLVLVVPSAIGVLLKPRSQPAVQGPATRVVILAPRPRGANPLPPEGLTLLDKALERVHLRGFGDPRILQSESSKKLVRVTGCSCATPGGTCAGTLLALERAFHEALGRAPRVEEAGCAPGRCDFVLAY